MRSAKSSLIVRLSVPMHPSGTRSSTSEHFSSPVASFPPLLPVDAPSLLDIADVKTSISNSAPAGFLTRNHNIFVPVYIHTAKCDGCEKRNDSVIQRCDSCGQQMCKVCAYGKMNDDTHRIKEANLDWTPIGNSRDQQAHGGSARRRKVKTPLGTIIRGLGPRVAKRKREAKSPQTPTPKRHRKAQKLADEIESEDGLSLNEDENDKNSEETDDNGGSSGPESRTNREKAITKTLVTPTSKRRCFAREHLDEPEQSDGLFVNEHGKDINREETDDDSGFGGLPPCKALYRAQDMLSRKPELDTPKEDPQSDFGEANEGLTDLQSKSSQAKDLRFDGDIAWKSEEKGSLIAREDNLDLSSTSQECEDDADGCEIGTRKAKEKARWKPYRIPRSRRSINPPAAEFRATTENNDLLLRLSQKYGDEAAQEIAVAGWTLLLMRYS